MTNTIAARKLEEVRVYDLNFERTKDFAARMQEELKDYGTRILSGLSHLAGCGAFLPEGRSGRNC